MSKNILVLLIFFFGLSLSAGAQQKQGTSVAREGCTVWITLQLGIVSDSADADVAMLKAALEPCWSTDCDMPCADPAVKICKLRSRVVIKKWTDIPQGDQAKYHKITMRAGEGVSSASIQRPNGGTSGRGTWYRQAYAPEVYCHETMHLCGLKDRYRDCRPDRLHVDNCKDGKACTPEQMGTTPACDGYEDDCMGTDVTKPFNCNNNLMEIVRMADNFDFVCPDSCCEIKKDSSHTSLPPDAITPYAQLEGGLALYTLKNDTGVANKKTLTGYNISIGIGATLPLTSDITVGAAVKYGQSSTSDKETTTYGMGSTEQHETFRISRLSLELMAMYQFINGWYSILGPEIGYIIAARDRYYGTSNFSGMSYPFGDKEFHKITAARRLQMGINIAIMKTIILQQAGVLSPYFNVYFPFTNNFDFGSLNNRMILFNIGAQFRMNGRR